MFSMDLHIKTKSLFKGWVSGESVISKPIHSLSEFKEVRSSSCFSWTFLHNPWSESFLLASEVRTGPGSRSRAEDQLGRHGGPTMPVEGEILSLFGPKWTHWLSSHYLPPTLTTSPKGSAKSQQAPYCDLGSVHIYNKHVTILTTPSFWKAPSSIDFSYITLNCFLFPSLRLLFLWVPQMNSEVGRPLNSPNTVFRIFFKCICTTI